MYWLLFVVYLLFFCWLATRVPFIRRSGIAVPLLIGLYLMKVVAALAYGYVFATPAFIGRSDTWRYYRESLAETDLLRADPVRFVSSFFQTNYATAGGLFSDTHSYWNDAKDAVIIKMMAVCNLFSGNNYYINALFFSFLFFIGVVVAYRLLTSLFPGTNGYRAVLIFCLPSFLFWCSGVHKDGLVFIALAALFYCFDRLLQQVKWQYIITSLFALLLLWYLRNYLVILLLPAMLTGRLYSRMHRRKQWVVPAMIVFAFLFFLLGKHIHPALDLPAIVAGKEAQFRALDGATRIAVPPLTADPMSFIHRLPSALDMLLLRPYPTEPGLLSLISSVEWIICLIVILCLLVYWIRNKAALSPTSVAVWLFALAAWLLIAYIVPFSGAIARYRSLYIPFIGGPLWMFWLSRSNIIKKHI